MLIRKFKELKTSTQISIKFTLFTIVLVFLFGIVANIMFFRSRYSKEALKLTIGPPPIGGNGGIKIVLGRNRMPDTEIFDINSFEGKAILASPERKSIIEIEDYYFIYKVINNKVCISNITPHINVQKNLIYTSIYLTFLFGVISYIISLFFVETSLKKLNKLLGFLNQIDIDNLDTKIEIKGHIKDEINMLSYKFNETLDKVHKQTLSLKDFVSNASHELKTPLMAISTEIDYIKKSKKYNKGLENIKTQIHNIDNLLNALTIITKIENKSKLETKKEDISQIIKNIIDTISKLNQDKKLEINTKISDKIEKKINKEGFNIIVKNILENAFKFTPNGGKISIILDKNKLEIKDNGIGISDKDINFIRERFRQADRSKTDTKSFGLGLYLTKLLTEKHGRNIDIQSKNKKGTTCTIKFS
ncbi:HAMP domain-containing histidine kinase [Candidatus Gracilibacteria bacterium]|nr:HAMP domain-containing histidine kinase [Candidatus Gracilibacteria bacterium]